MKEIITFLLIILTGGICFAQESNIHVHEMDNSVNGTRGAYYIGNTNMSGMAQLQAELEYAIAPKQFDSTLSGNLIKVMFYHSTDQGNTNTSYTIKIYEDINLIEDSVGRYDINSCGTLVYLQDYTAVEDGFQEVELTQPFAIPTGEFWVAIRLNSTGNVYLGGEGQAVEGQYYMQYELNEDRLVWIAPWFINQSDTTLYSFALAVYVDDGKLSDIQSLLYLDGNGDSEITDTLILAVDEDFTIYPAIYNAGPDIANGAITYDFQIDGTSMLSEGEQSMSVSLETDSLLFLSGLSIPASSFNGFNGSFEFCFISNFNGDPDIANNSTCITVIRGQTSLYNITVLSNNDAYGYVSGGGTYEEGTEIMLTATPYEGYRFVSWSDENADNPRTITVTSDSTFVAMFEAEQVQQYTITVLSNNDAYGSVSGGGTYYDGDTVVILAMPNAGYNFVFWDDGYEFNPRAVVVTSDSTFIADFAKCEITYAIDTVVNNFVTVGDHTFYSTGNYTFAVSHETACDTIYDIRLRVLAEPVYDIGPNPAKSLLNINSDGFISAVEFYSVTGQLVMRKEVNGYEAEFDVEGLVDGVYILRIYGEESSLPSVHKVVKE